MNGVDQIIDGRQAVFFSDVSDMGISHRRVGVGMAEKGLNVTKA
jgi:hypothetical protein